MKLRLAAEPLAAESFAPFGEVLQDKTARRIKDINQNTAKRFDDLAAADLSRAGGRPCLSLFRAAPRPHPIKIAMLERHPLGSQAFMPAGEKNWLAVVAPGGDAPDLAGIRCFLARGFQGVNYRAGTWHHPLLVLESGHDFWVLDRAAPAGETANANLHEFWFAPEEERFIVL